MIRSSHIIVSTTIVSSVLCLASVPAKDGVPILLGTVIGAQLPDIDHPQAEISRITGPIGRFFSDHGHRYMTHTLFALVPFIALWLSIPTHTMGEYGMRMFTTGLLAGYLLHLIEDNFSRQGVLWFCPFTHYETSAAGHQYKKRRFHSWYYTTGGKEEAIIRNVCLAIQIFLCYQLYALWF